MVLSFIFLKAGSTVDCAMLEYTYTVVLSFSESLLPSSGYTTFLFFVFLGKIDISLCQNSGFWCLFISAIKCLSFVHLKSLIGYTVLFQEHFLHLWDQISFVCLIVCGVMVWVFLWFNHSWFVLSPSSFHLFLPYQCSFCFVCWCVLLTEEPNEWNISICGLFWWSSALTFPLITWLCNSRISC